MYDVIDIHYIKHVKCVTYYNYANYLRFLHPVLGLPSTRPDIRFYTSVTIFLLVFSLRNALHLCDFTPVSLQLIYT